MKNTHFLLSLAALLMVLSASAAETNQSLTLATARARALQQHPRITVAELKTLLARANARETSSAYRPNLSLNGGGVLGGNAGTRIVGGPLTVSSVFDRLSAGATLTQLVTDFGRTSNLLESSRLHADAEERNTEATRAQILLQVDAAYYSALQAMTVLHVADETVKNREVLRDQVSVLASNQIKSELDVSFAEVSLEEGHLLQVRARNDIDAAFTTLAALLGSRENEQYSLDEGLEPPPLAASASALIAASLRDRPDLQRLRLERDSAAKLVRAEQSLSYPTISVQGTTGVIPYHEPGLNNHYSAAGVVVSVPLYSGGLYAARKDAAHLRAQAAEATLADEENNAVRDTRIAWLNANNARERLAITTRLIAQARQAYALADARYKAGSSSFVELSQAQLNQISAEIAHTSARYEYLLRRSLLDFQTGALH